ncbi:MAG: hypothetical protein CMJ78_23505 [Planctomycetaceae bacterium]|nr:hypothetical protein [Planctomycetaceae bacterium]
MKTQPQSPMSDHLVSRRQFAGISAAALGSSLLPLNQLWAESPRKRPRVAVVLTIMTYRSHAHVILENFVGPYMFNGKKTEPGVDVVSIYADQRRNGDMLDDFTKHYKIPMFKTIEEALCVGGKNLDVEAVLLIGEHGNYPRTELGQTKYPRKRFFDEAAAVMRRTGRSVPIFNDKHLSYRWDWAKQMYDTSREMKIPFLAGSSVPLAERRPALDLPVGAKIDDAIAVHGGPLESYDFHGLELLQSMVESRKGGETGVASIEFLEGDAALKAAEEGRWSKELANAAMKAELGYVPKRFQQIKGEPEVVPHVLLVNYKDGLKGTVLRVGRDSTRWNFACRMNGKPDIHATAFNVGPWENRCLFKALSHAIQHHFIHGKAPYPVERTLLVTGMLEAAMKARATKSKRLETPHLEFAYAAQDYNAMREMGASWKVITNEIPQPPGIHRQVFAK